MVLGDKKMFLFGGKGASYFNDLYTLTSGTLAWAKPRITGTSLSTKRKTRQYERREKRWESLPLECVFCGRKR
jgi:hypothetical protein